MSKDNGGIPKHSGKANPIDTDYQVGQDNVVLSVGPFGLDIHNRVFAVSGLAIVIFVFATLIFREQVEPIFVHMRSWLTSSLDWFFILSGNIFVLVCIGLAISPLGKVRIGGTEALPDYSYAGWQCCLPQVWVSGWYSLVYRSQCLTSVLRLQGLCWKMKSEQIGHLSAVL